MASKLKLWRKVGRFLTPAIVVFFFLPFFGISCQGMEVYTMSGADMVGGCRPGGMISEIENMEKEKRAENPERASVMPSVSKVKRSPLAIAALLVALISAGLAWVRTRKALMASFALALAGLVAMGALYVVTIGQMNDAGKTMLEKKGDQPDRPRPRMGRGLGDDIEFESGSRWGFWITSFGFIAVAALTGMALRERDDGSGVTENVVPPQPPPAAPPPT